MRHLTVGHKQKIRQALMGNTNGPRTPHFDCLCKKCGAAFRGYHLKDCLCSPQCRDFWAYHYGKKGQTAKQRRVDRQLKHAVAVGNCALCGIGYLEIVRAQDLGCLAVNPTGGLFQRDHILPRSAGGDDSENNLRDLCWFCNSARKDIAQKYDEAIASAGRAFWSAIHSIRD